MAGLGKTCLAQLIYHDETLKGHFTNLIWVDVRRNFNLERFGKELLESVTEMEINLNSWESIVKRIDEVLRGKRFLLVLDDLWKASFADWKKIQELLKKGIKGNKILVTSRTQEILNTIRASNPLFLDLLPEEECDLLFAKKAFVGGKPPGSEIEEIDKKIVQKCNRLPLAIAAMGSTLYDCTDIHTWKSIERDGIWEKERQNALNGRPTILPALRLSYDHLPSHLKRCFIYCNLFPQGYMYDKNELIKLWMAEGYVESREESNLDQIGDDYFDIIESRSFFQPINVDNKDGHMIHDLFHELAQSVSAQSSIQVEDNKSCSIHENSRHDVQQPASQILLKATKLRTILLPVRLSRNFGQTLNEIFCTQKYLRVLDLSSTKMTEVPKSIGKLKLLRYLDLSDTDIRRLPDSICKLINLQTLKLLRCVWLSELPNGFNRLSNLWHLELDEISLRDNLHRSGRNSPSWSFRRDNRCCVVDETESSPCDGTVLDGGIEIKGRVDLDSGNVSGGGTPSRSSVTPTSRKSPAYEGHTASTLTPSDASSLSNRFTVVNNPIGSPEISETVSSKLPFFMSPPSFSTLRAGPSSSQRQLTQPSSTPSRRARRSPGHQLFRQISDSRILGLKSPNSNSLSEGRTSFVLPTFGNDLTTGSQGGSSDGWSLRTFSELVASSQRERWSFDSEHFGSGRLKISGSSSRFSCSPSIDLRTCGACSKLLSERAFFVGDDVPVVAVLVCGHVYHAECLDTMTSEANKYDPACPICTVGEKQVLKMSRKVMKAEAELKMRFHKKLKNRVMDSYFDNNLDNFNGDKSTSEQDKKLHKMEASSSSKMSFGKPFLKRHFSLGSKWIRSTSENDSAKRKGFWGKYRKD
ncbi:hypothetical protein V2J09_011699 [Rumex salicifolius]